MMNKFEKMYKQEKKEHPWATPKQVARIVHDHMKEGKTR